MRRAGRVHLLVCLSPNYKKRDFLKSYKQVRAMISIDDLYTGFSKNPLFDHKNPRWRRSAILDLFANMQKRDFLKN